MINRSSSDAMFVELTLQHEPELRRYCQKLAGAEWDGEDLFQETMLKAFRRYKRWPERELSKPYLYRIAVNAWLDICRSRKIAFLPELLEDHAEIAYSEWSGYDVRESLEYLMDALEPRQAALIVLTDVFGFTPTETSTALSQPVSAIKAALHRARTRLKKAATKQLHRFADDEEGFELRVADRQSGSDAELFEAFLKAFRAADAKAMFDSYRELSDRGVKIESVRFMQGRVWFTFKDPDGNVLTVSSPLIAKQEG